jgi:hypothetical protein
VGRTSPSADRICHGNAAEAAGRSNSLRPAPFSKATFCSIAESNKSRHCPHGATGSSLVLTSHADAKLAYSGDCQRPVWAASLSAHGAVLLMFWNTARTLVRRYRVALTRAGLDDPEDATGRLAASGGEATDTRGAVGGGVAPIAIRPGRTSPDRGATDVPPRAASVVSSCRRVMGCLCPTGRNIGLVSPAEFRGSSMPMAKSRAAVVVQVDNSVDFVTVSRLDARAGAFGATVRAWMLSSTHDPPPPAELSHEREHALALWPCSNVRRM